MKKILLALALLTIASSAFAQGNPTCPTRPAGDSSNACASTAFVQNAITAPPLPYGNVFVGNSSNVATATPNPTIGVPGTLAGSISWTGAGSPLQAQYYRFGQPFACTTSYGLLGGGWRQLTSTSTDFSSSFTNIYQCYNYNFLATSGTYNNGNVAIGSDADYSINAPNLFYTGQNTLQLVKGTIVGGNAIQTDASPITYWYHQTNLTSVGGANYYPTDDSLMSHFFFSGDSNNAGANGGPVIYGILGIQAHRTATATPRGIMYFGTADDGPAVSAKIFIARGLYTTGFTDPGVGNIAAGVFVGTNFSNYTTPTYGIDIIGVANAPIASLKQTDATLGAAFVATNSSNNSLTFQAVGTGFAGNQRGRILANSVEALTFDLAGTGLATFRPGSVTSGLNGTAQGTFILAGLTSGTLTISGPAIAGANTLTFPAGTTNFTATGGTSQVVKQTSVGGAFTVARLACADLSDAGTGCTGALANPLPLANGGTNASLTASNGGIVYSTASAFAILSGTATARQIPLSGASGAPAWSTATYPATTTVSRILYSSSANVIGEITTANTAALVTNSSGVPAYTTGAVASRVLRTDGTTITFAQVTLTTDITGVLPVANGGTNCSVASGTCLDNITGFSTTGYLLRTGAGAYTIQSSKQVFSGNSGGSALSFACTGATTPCFYWVGGQSLTESFVKTPMNIPGTFKQLRVESILAPTLTFTYVIRVRKNLADSGVTCTITAGTTACTDSTNSFTVVAGDFLDIATDLNAAETNNGFFKWSIEFDNP